MGKAGELDAFPARKRNLDACIKMRMRHILRPENLSGRFVSVKAVKRKESQTWTI